MLKRPLALLVLLLTLPLSCLATRPAGYCWPDVPVIVKSWTIPSSL